MEYNLHTLLSMYSYTVTCRAAVKSCSAVVISPLSMQSRPLLTSRGRASGEEGERGGERGTRAAAAV